MTIKRGGLGIGVTVKICTKAVEGVDLNALWAEYQDKRDEYNQTCSNFGFLRETRQ